MTKDLIGGISAALYGVYLSLIWFTDLHYTHNGVTQVIAVAAIATMIWRISKG